MTSLAFVCSDTLRDFIGLSLCYVASICTHKVEPNIGTSFQSQNAFVSWPTDGHAKFPNAPMTRRVSALSLTAKIERARFWQA